MLVIEVASFSSFNSKEQEMFMQSGVQPFCILFFTTFTVHVLRIFLVHEPHMQVQGITQSSCGAMMRTTALQTTGRWSQG